MCSRANTYHLYRIISSFSTFTGIIFKAGILAWPPEAATEHFESPAESTYDVVSCLFRLEDTPPDERKRLLSAMKSWLKPGGQLIIGYVSASSFHQSSERLRKRRGGPGGVEYVLSPDPNIGPFEALAPSSIEAMLEAEGIRVEQRLGLGLAARSMATGQPSYPAISPGVPGDRKRAFRWQCDEVAPGRGEIGVG